MTDSRDAQYDYEIPDEEAPARKKAATASDAKYDYEIPAGAAPPKPPSVAKAADAKYDYEIPTGEAGPEPEGEYAGKPRGYEPKTTSPGFILPDTFSFGEADPKDAMPIKTAAEIRAARAAARPDEFAALRAKAAPVPPALPEEAQPIWRADQIRKAKLDRERLGQLERFPVSKVEPSRPEALRQRMVAQANLPPDDEEDAAWGGGRRFPPIPADQDRAKFAEQTTGKPGTPLADALAKRYEPEVPDTAADAAVHLDKTSHRAAGAVAGAFKAAGKAYRSAVEQASVAMDADQTGVTAVPNAAAGLVMKGADLLGKAVDASGQNLRSIARRVAGDNTDAQGLAEAAADGVNMMMDPRVTYGFLAGHGLAKATLGAAAPLVERAVAAAFGASGAKDVAEGLTDRYIAKNILGDEDMAREGTRKAAFGAGLAASILGGSAVESGLARANESIEKRGFAQTMNRVAAQYNPEQAAKRAGLLRDIGLPETASDEQIASAVRRIVKETHPDRPENTWDALSRERFNRAIEARDKMPDEQVWEEPMDVPAKNVQQRILEAVMSAPENIKRAVFSVNPKERAAGARDLVEELLAKPITDEVLGSLGDKWALGAGDAPSIKKGVASAPRIDLPQRPVPPGMRLAEPAPGATGPFEVPPEVKAEIAKEAANDRENGAGVPSEERGREQEPVEAEPVEGAGAEAPRDGRLVQGAQAGQEVGAGGPVPQAEAGPAGRPDGTGHGSGRDVALSPGDEPVQGEAPLDMRAQEQALLAGARQAILFHKNGPGPDSAFPPFGIERAMTPAGEIWFRTDTGLTAERVKDMASSVEGLGKLLEMPPGGRPKGPNPKNITVIDGDGNEVWTAEVTDETRQKALKRATAMAEKIGGHVIEQTRQQTVEGRKERIKEQAKAPLPPKPGFVNMYADTEHGVNYETHRLKDGRFSVVVKDADSGETVSGARIFPTLEAAMAHAKELHRKGLGAPPTATASDAKYDYEIPPEAPAATDKPQPGDVVRYRFANGQEEQGKVASVWDDGSIVVSRPGGGESLIAPTPTDAKGKKRNHLVSIVDRAGGKATDRPYEEGGPEKPAKKAKKAKPGPAVDMNRQAVANHLKLTVGSGWEEELVGLDRAAQEYEADGEGSKAEFWRNLAESTIGTAPEPPKPVKPVEAPRVETKAWENAATGPEGVVETATGTEIPFHYAVVDAREPITSHDSAGNPNPGYALEGETIQNRDRSDQKSVEQMSRIKGNPKLRLLSEAPTTNDGAPLVRPDKRVLAGNGRMAGLAAAHEAGSAEQYKKDLPAKLKQLGFDDAAIKKAMSMERPALVRLMNPGFEYDQTRLARDTNVSTGLQLGAAEKGRSDASLMMAPASATRTSRVLGYFQPDEDGNLMSPANREFAHAFAREFVPEQERGGMFRGADLTPDGAARIKSALIAAAYGDSKVVDRLLEGGGDETVALRTALLNAAPAFANVNLRQRAGELDPLDVTKPVVEAAEFINDMRASGRKLQDVLHPKYGELISATDRLSPEGLDVVLMTEPLKFEKKDKDGKVKITTEASSATAKRLTGIFTELAKVANTLTKVETGGGLFGADEMAALAEEPPSLAEALKIARRNYELEKEIDDAPLLAGEKSRAPEGPGTGDAEASGAGAEKPEPGEGPPSDGELSETPTGYGRRELLRKRSEAAQRLAKEIDRRYEAGELDGIEDLEQRLEKIESEDLSAEDYLGVGIDGQLGLGESELEDDGRTSIADELARGYARYLDAITKEGQPTGREDWWRSDADSALQHLRSIIEGSDDPTWREQRPAGTYSNAQILAAAKDAYDRKKSLREKYKSAPSGELDRVKAWLRARGAEIAEEATAYGQPAIAAPTFFSAVERAIDAIPFRSIPAADLYARLQKTPGVKKEELEWLGLPQWLKERDRVTKDEVKKFLDENKVEVKTITLENGPRVEVPQYLRDRLAEEEAAEDAANKAFQESAEADGAGQTSIANAIFGYPPNGSSRKTRDAHAAMLEVRRKRSNTETQIATWKRDHAPKTKYESWTLPGGENYREVILQRANGPRPHRTMDTIAREMGFNGWTVALTPEQKAKVEAAFEKQEKSPKPFLGPHFQIENELGHYRAKDRIDAEGKKVLAIEEVQSDHAEQGRMRGYAELSALAEAEKRVREINTQVMLTRADLSDLGVGSGHKGNGETFWDRTREEYGDYLTVGHIGEDDKVTIRKGATPEQASAIQRLARLLDEARTARGVRDLATVGVPPYPFKKSWPLLLFKHALRYAAENGYDRIAWTPGAVQEQRYWGHQAIVPAVSRWNEITKPESVRKLGDDVLGPEMAAAMSLEPVDGGVLAVLKHDQVRRAVISLLPVDVVDVLARANTTPEKLLRKPEVIFPSLPVDRRGGVALGVRAAMRTTSAAIRAKLSGPQSGGADAELLPALRARDLDTREVAGLLDPQRLFHGGSSRPPASATPTGTGTEPSARRQAAIGDGKLGTTEFADRLNAHIESIHGREGLLQQGVQPPPGTGMTGFYDRILPAEVNKYVKPWGAKVGQTYLSPDRAYANDDATTGTVAGARPMWSIDITPAMREAALAGQPLFEKGAEYNAPGGEGDERSADGLRGADHLPERAVRLTGSASAGEAVPQRPGLRSLSERRAARKKAEDSARALLADLRARDVRGVEGPARTFAIEASRLADRLESNGFVSLLGYAVASPEALGVIGQVAANPMFEVGRALFSDPRSLEVLDDIAYSAGLPEEVNAAGTLIEPAMLALEARKRPGQKVRSFHNHPNGDPTPSEPDIAYTKECARLIGEDYEGHTVIDHTKFAVIHPDGSVTYHDLTPEAIANRPDLFKEPDEQRGIGRVVMNWNDLAALGNELHNDEKSVTIVFGIGHGDFRTTRVRAVASLPLGVFLNVPVAAKILKARMGTLGGSHAFAYHSGRGLTLMQQSELYHAADQIAYDEGALSDFMLDKDSLAARGHRSGRGLPPLAERSARPGVQQGITGNVRLSEDNAPYAAPAEGEAASKSLRQRAFDRWFRGSVVVNEDGSPKVMYHGTRSEREFDTFWTKGYNVDLGAHFGTVDQANDIIGTRQLIRPSASPYLAASTKDLETVRANTLKRIYPVYLSIKNPLRLPDLGGWVRPRSYIVNIPANATGDEGELRKLAEEAEEKFQSGDTGAIEEFPGQVKQLLEDMGYDGIVYVNENEADDEEADSYIVFHPWQVKSATGNKGTFDRENPSILNEEDTGYGVPPTREFGIPADAPHVALQSNSTSRLQGDPDYKEAKAGDREAAARLVDRLVDEKAIERAKAFGKGATYVYPHAEEAAGRNAIPGMAAGKLAAELGGTVGEIVQSNRVHHTGANAKQRIISRATFDGPVEKGGRYVLVDDVTTMGGTLAELANYIQKNGGTVVGTFLLAEKIRGDRLVPEKGRVDEVERRFGDTVRSSLGIEPAALTRPEVEYLLNHKSAESLGVTLATGRREIAERLRAKAVREDGLAEEPSSYGKKSALDYASRFAPGAAKALRPRGPEDEIRLAATDPAAGVFSAVFASRAPKASKTSQLPSPLDSHDPAVEARLRAAEGIVAPTAIQRVKQALVDLEHSFTRHFIHLDTKESKTIAADVDILRQLEGSPDFAKAVALDTLQYITDGLDKPAARLFTRILALRDLHRSIDEGLYEDKDELPFGYEDKAAVTYDLRRYEALAKDDPAVAAALDKRERYAAELTQRLVDMELLPEDVLEDPRYYHRQVMAIFNQKQAAYVGTGSADVRVHKKGFQKARSGGGDFNMRYQEAEFEWMAQAHSLIAMREALDRLREANDIKPGLESQAKWMNIYAVYGGKETYQRVQALKAEKARIYTEAGLALDSDEKKRIAAINSELEEIDPLKPFSDRIGWAIHDLGKRAEEGALDYVPANLQEAVDELRSSSEWEEFRGDSESELFFPLLNYLVSNGKAGSNEAAEIFKAIADKKKFIKEELGPEFKTWRDLMPDTHPLAPKSRAVVWQPEKGSMFYRAQTLPERALDRFVEELKSSEDGVVDKEAVEKLLAKAREAWVRGGPKQEWVIPEGLARTLDNWKGGGREKGLESIQGTLLQSWKQWVLLNPVRALRYNLNNESGDVDVVIAAFPGALRGWAKAARDLWQYTVKEEKGDTALVEEIQRAMKMGVISSGLTVQEIPDINEAGAFKALTSDDPNVVQKALETYWSGTKKFSTWRENTLRLAVFRYLEGEMKRGAKLYGASRAHEVDAIKDPAERAAKVTRELVGDYGNISVAGQWIRRHLMPFYSWIEINAPRYVRMLRNAAREDGEAGGEGRARRVAGIGAKKIAINYAKLALFAPLLYGAIQAWNNLMFPEEEQLLGHDNRKMLHLILGRNSDGSIRSVRLQGALSDALEWFGAGNVVADVKDLAGGRSTWKNKLADAVGSPIDKIVGAWEPFSKSLFELSFGYKAYPSVFKEGSLEFAPHKIRDRAEYVGDLAWPMGALYRRVTGKPRRPSPDMGIPGAGPLLDTLLVQRTDPGEAAYWYTKNLASKFLEAQGKSASTGGPTGDAKEKSDALYYFKRACEWNDEDAAQKWLAEYYKLGGTPAKMREAFVREHPIGGLPLGKRGAFLNSLSDRDKEIVQSAVDWYEKGRQRMREVQSRVPFEAAPKRIAQ